MDPSALQWKNWRTVSKRSLSKIQKNLTIEHYDMGEVFSVQVINSTIIALIFFKYWVISEQQKI